MSRRSNATTSSYSPTTSRAFIGSDSGSSSGDALLQGVYENFRRELEMSSASRENLEEANSALSDEQSSGTLSSPGQSDILRTAAQGTVRKAGALAVKNFLVHKKNKKVELATRRKWKHYWVSLKGLWPFKCNYHLGVFKSIKRCNKGTAPKKFIASVKIKVNR